MLDRIIHCVNIQPKSHLSCTDPSYLQEDLQKGSSAALSLYFLCSKQEQLPAWPNELWNSSVLASSLRRANRRTNLWGAHKLFHWRSPLCSTAGRETGKAAPGEQREDEGSGKDLSTASRGGGKTLEKQVTPYRTDAWYAR